MPASDTIAKYIASNCSPVLMTIASKSVEKSCQLNGVSFADLLSKGLSVKTTSKSYKLKNFTIRVVPNHEIAAKDQELVENCLINSLAKHSPDISDEYFNSIKITDEGIPGEYFDTPYISSFLSELFRSLNDYSFDLFGHPFSILYAVSSNDTDPIKKMEKLTSEKLPQNFKDGVYNDDIPSFYVLVDDASTESELDLSKTMKDLKKKFGSSKCFLLTINSSHEVPNMDQIDVWSEKKLNSMTNSKFNVSPPENGVYGSLLSPDDIIGIQTLMKTIIEKGIITDMENKMDELDTIIQNERKGLKNMFRGWGSGTVKKGRAGDNYTQDSIDWKLIMYANMLFMVKDYESALTHYKLAKDDFKSEGVPLPTGNTYFMIGLCQFLTNQTEKNINHNMEQCYNTLKSVNKASQKLLSKRILTRMTLLYYYMLDRNPEFDIIPIITLLIKLSPDETPVCSGIILEKTAECYLRFDPPRIKRNAFHLILSGNSYTECDGNLLSKHIIRNYSLAKLVYNENWDSIEDHIGHTMAVQLSHDKQYNRSVELYSDIIGKGKQSKDQQSEYIDELKKTIDILLISSSLQQEQQQQQQLEQQQNEDNNSKLYSLNISLPEIDNTSVQLLSCNNAMTDPVVEHQSLSENQIWNDINDIIVREQEAISLGYTRLKRKRRAPGYYPSQSKVKDRVVNEPIFISFDLINPLDIELEIKDMKLNGNITPLNSENNGENSGENNNSNVDSLELESQSIKIDPKSTKRITLKLIPKIPGKLEIKGVSWIVLDNIYTTHNFELVGPLLNDSRRNRALRTHATDNRLMSNICEDRPWLGVNWDNFPSIIYEGEIVKTEFTLKNFGKIPIGNLIICSPTPIWCILNNKRDQILEPIGPTGIIIPLLDKLESNESVDFTAYIRGPGVGSNRECRIIFQYEMIKGNTNSEDNSKKKMILETRQVHMLKVFKCISSLKVQTTANPSYENPIENQFHLDITMPKSDVPFKAQVEISQITMIGENWSCKHYTEKNPDAITVVPGMEYCHTINITPTNESSSKTTNNNNNNIKYINLEFENKSIKKIEDSKINLYFVRMANGRAIYHSENEYYEKKVKEFENRGLPYDDPTPLDKLPLSYSLESLIMNKDEIHLILLWNIKGSSNERVGQTHIMKRNISLMANRNNPVLLSLNYEVNVNHDFENEGYYKANINAKLFLPEQQQQLNNNNNNNNEVIIGFGVKNLPPSIFWIKKTSYILKLQPNKMENISLSCMITSPGIYDLNLFTISILDENYNVINKSHFITNQYLIIVNNSNTASNSSFSSTNASNSLSSNNLRTRSNSVLMAMQQESPFIDSGPLYDGIDIKAMYNKNKKNKKDDLISITLTPLPPPDM